MLGLGLYLNQSESKSESVSSEFSVSSKSSSSSYFFLPPPCRITRFKSKQNHYISKQINIYHKTSITLPTPNLENPLETLFSSQSNLINQYYIIIYRSLGTRHLGVQVGCESLSVCSRADQAGWCWWVSALDPAARLLLDPHYRQLL